MQLALPWTTKESAPVVQAPKYFAHMSYIRVGGGGKEYEADTIGHGSLPLDALRMCKANADRLADRWWPLRYDVRKGGWSAEICTMWIDEPNDRFGYGAGWLRGGLQREG